MRDMIGTGAVICACGHKIVYEQEELHWSVCASNPAGWPWLPCPVCKRTVVLPPIPFTRGDLS